MMNKVFMFFMVLSFSSYSQHEGEYWHSLGTPSGQWVEIELPTEAYGKGRPDFYDYRVHAVSVKGDTSEVPYLVRENHSVKEVNTLIFNELNKTVDEEFQYVTYELNNGQRLNSMSLNIDEPNFDVNVKLEGSNDRQKWFTIIEDYRILSATIDTDKFYFADLKFPTVENRYLRLRLPKEEITLSNAFLTERTESGGRYKDHEVDFKIEEDVEAKKTSIFIGLPEVLPLYSLKAHIADTLDYFRHATIFKLTDSTYFKEQWHHHYSKITAGTFTSMQDNEEPLPRQMAQKLKIEVYNHNDRPLDFQGFSVKGNEFTLVARTLGKDHTYFLSYGGKNRSKPFYDIQKFDDLVPEELQMIKATEAVYHPYAEVKRPLAIFDSKWWIWGLMIIIITVLGFFTLKMIKDS